MEIQQVIRCKKLGESSEPQLDDILNGCPQEVVDAPVICNSANLQTQTGDDLFECSVEMVKLEDSLPFRAFRSTLAETERIYTWSLYEMFVRSVKS